jgi:hypothetical protein
VPACPAYGERGERARELAAACRARPSVAAASTWGADALDGMMALDMLTDRMALTVEIEHRELP